MGLGSNVKIFEGGHLTPLKRLKNLIETLAPNEDPGSSTTETVRVGKKLPKTYDEDHMRESSIVVLENFSGTRPFFYVLAQRKDKEIEYPCGIRSRVKLVEAVFGSGVRFLAAKIEPLWIDVIREGMVSWDALTNVLREKLGCDEKIILEIKGVFDRNMPKNKKIDEILKIVHGRITPEKISEILNGEEYLYGFNSKRTEIEVLGLLDRLFDVFVYKNNKGILNVVLVQKPFPGEELFCFLNSICSKATLVYRRDAIAGLLTEYTQLLDKSLKNGNGDGIAVVGDIKPENILIKFEGKEQKPNFTFVDFENVIFVSDLDANKEYAHKKCGTLVYSAPEVLEKKPLSDKIDVYSLGLICLGIATGVSYIVWMNSEQYEPGVLQEKYIEYSLKKENQNVQGLPQDEIAFIARMVAKNPKDRPAVHDVICYIEQKITSEGAIHFAKPIQVRQDSGHRGAPPVIGSERSAFRKLGPTV